MSKNSCKKLIKTLNDRFKIDYIGFKRSKVPHCDHKSFGNNINSFRKRGVSSRHRPIWRPCVHHLAFLNSLFKWVSYFSREQGGKIAEANLWDHFGMHYCMLWWLRKFENNLNKLFTNKLGRHIALCRLLSSVHILALENCSVMLFLRICYCWGFVVRTQHFRILETCRIDLALVNKGFNVSFHMKSCSSAQTDIQIYPASRSSPSVCLPPWFHLLKPVLQ